MSDEKKETKCCGCCKGANKELSNEDLDKVSGGLFVNEKGKDCQLVNGKYICHSYQVTEGPLTGAVCKNNKTVDGIQNVCTCTNRTNGYCCLVYGDNCTCSYWIKEIHKCVARFMA